MTDALNDAVARGKLEYLQMITPRRSGTGTSRYVLQQGELVEGKAAALGSAYKSYTPGRLDPEDVARHNRLVERFNFIRNK